MANSAATFPNQNDLWMARPSWVPVFVKSLHLIAIAWIATVGFLWIAVEQHRADGSNVLVHAVLPALAIAAAAIALHHGVNALGGSVRSHAHEWASALEWVAVPILMLVGMAILAAG